MNIIQLLKHDHVEMKALMERLEEEAKKNHKATEALFEKFKEEFMRHDKAEEVIVYPVLESINELNYLVRKGYQAHHMVEVGILELKLVPFSSEAWAPKFSVIRDSILTHAEEEEKILFPEMSKYLDKSLLEELADKVKEQRS